MAQGGAENPVICPLCCTVSESPNLVVTERPCHWGQGLYHFTPSHKAQTLAVFQSSLEPAARSPGSTRDWPCLAISPAETPQPLLWPAGPALIPAVCSPEGPWPPAGMEQGMVQELHPRNLVRYMDLKNWWPLRQKKREEGTLLHFNGGICGCSAERGPYMGTLCNKCGILELNK